MRAAAVQLNSTDDRERNLEVAEKLVRDAAADGAELVALPEKWTFLGPGEAMRRGGRAPRAAPRSAPPRAGPPSWGFTCWPGASRSSSPATRSHSTPRS